MKPHELAKAFPEITGEDFKALALDIKKHGLRHKIVTLDGKILDGVNRHRACIASGVTPEFEEYNGDNPYAFVVSENLKRRHLTESQRAMVAAALIECANLHTTITDAANSLNVSRSSVHKAIRVKRESAKAGRDVRDGKKRLDAADKELHPEKQTTSPPEQPQAEIEKESKPSPQKATPFTLARFQQMADALEGTIPDDVAEKIRHECGNILQRIVQRQMNWGQSKKGKGAYGF